ncbi:MAG: D-2-hydroxyacid dehydrogenase [Armatimonadota bacterium]|nr:D-2-hydroxyacid dehydrogenase [Armatimonadota bacterium]
MNVLIASYLEPELVDRIKRVGAVRVIYEPALLPSPRYPCDHVGHPHRRTTDEERRWRRYLAEAEVMFDFDHTNLGELASLIPKVRWIQATSTGIGQLLLRTGLVRSPIVFTTARGIHARPLADFVLLTILWFAKDGFRMMRDQAARRWERYTGRDVRGATVGIVGLGTIGREVARSCRAMGMRVVATRRTVPPGACERDVDVLVPISDLPWLLASADYVVLAVPHTPQTERLIGRRELETMRRDAVLINVARGAVVDEDALIDALRDGRLRGAALDVFATEPLPADSPLWGLPNVLVSPHSASTVESENARLTDLFCDNLERYLRGLPLLNVFDRERLY